jgi:hypothetical protein
MCAARSFTDLDSRLPEKGSGHISIDIAVFFLDTKPKVLFMSTLLHEAMKKLNTSIENKFKE